jgi:propane monooxygenase reductase subunit
MRLVDGDIEAREGSSALRREERDEGFFLACVSRPLEDCIVDASTMGVSEENFLPGDRPQTFLAELARNERRSRGIQAIRLRLIEPETIDFVAGQFVQIELPTGSAWRAYSIASPPSQSGLLDLNVKLHADGRFSSMLRSGIALGTRLRFLGPFGGLRIRLSHRPIIMAANGSGLSPMLSMLADLAEKGCQRSIRLFVGAGGVEELFAREQLAALQTAMPQLEVITTLSRTWPADWPGERGSLHDVMARRILSAVEHDAYLCGATSCVETTRSLLVKLGMRRRNIHFDVFTPAV